MEYKSESVSLEDGEEKPLSIAYVVPSYPELSETFVWREVAAMTQAGHKVLIVALREAKTVAQDVRKPDVVIYRRWPTAIRSIARTLCTRPRLATKAISSALFDAVFPGEKTSFSARAKCLVQAFAGISIARKLSSARCSVIHAQFAHASASVAMYASIATGIPWTMTGHANDLFERRQLLRRKLSRSNGVACISDWHASLYRRISLTVSKKLATVRCGVDVPRSSGRNLLTDGKSPFRVISVGRLVEKKGFDQLLRAYSELRDQVSVPTSLSVIGDGPEFHRLTLLARSLGVQEHVHFFGACEHRNVRMEISKAQCFVLACREDSAGDRDGIPIVLMEAMACGVPAVSGCIDAIHELIEHEKTGLLVDATATSSLAKTIQSVVENPSHAREMGARGRERIISEFSTVENSKRLEDLFRSACMG
ncbi:MAG: glycosyltransferase family 4 protein [Planctomycetota bacterium]